LSVTKPVDRDPVSAAHVGCEVVTKWCIRLEEWSFVLRKRQLIIVTALGRQSDGLRKSLCACRTIAKDGQRRRRQKAHQKRPACLKHGFTLFTRAPHPVHYTEPTEIVEIDSQAANSRCEKLRVGTLRPPLDFYTASAGGSRRCIPFRKMKS
jgi:hypothetical protein